jgi:hypothetical protein
MLFKPVVSGTYTHSSVIISPLCTAGLAPLGSTWMSLGRGYFALTWKALSPQSTLANHLHCLQGSEITFYHHYTLHLQHNNHHRWK